MNRKAAEPFGRPPKRLADDLALGKLTPWGFLLLSWLELRTNHRLDPPRWIGTTGTIHAETGWPHSRRHLRDELDRLRRDGYISYDVEAGSPKAFEIFPVRALVEYETEETWNGEALFGAQVSGKRSSSRDTRKPARKREPAPRRRGSVPAPQTQKRPDARSQDLATLKDSEGGTAVVDGRPESGDQMKVKDRSGTERHDGSVAVAEPPRQRPAQPVCRETGCRYRGPLDADGRCPDHVLDF